MRRPILRQTLFAAAICLLSSLPTGSIHAQDWVWANREMAETSAMHNIAVIQAAAGDIQGAKRTASQIGEVGERAAADVTVVWFAGGQPIYDQPPCARGCAALVQTWLPEPPQPSSATALYGDRDSPNLAANPPRVPSTVPSGLPANYLAPDPRHGGVVDFSDEQDAQGTRVTGRTYADGYAVIETPK